MIRLIHFARAMRRHGYRLSHDKSKPGLMMFSIRFRNGFGATEIVPTFAITESFLSLQGLATFLLRKHATAARVDLKGLH